MIVLTLVAVVAVIWLILSRRTEQRGMTDFLTAAEQATELQASAAERIDRVFAEVGPLLTRQEVVTLLSEAVDATTEAETLLDVDVPARAARSFGYISAASADWKQGVEDAQRVILGLMDGDLGEDGPSAIRDVIALLRAGDTSYALFTSEIEAVEVGSAMAEFPAIAFIDPDPGDPVRFDEQQFALRIALAYNLSPRHDIGVVGMTLPEPVGVRGGIPIVPASEALGVTAVISNHGNEPQGSFTVMLSVLDVDTGETHTDSATVASLDAGASTTVDFSSIPVEPGGLYQAVLTISIDDDGNTDNNTWDMTFIWNEAS